MRGHSVTWSDREVGILASPVPHLLMRGHDSTALSRLDRYFDPRPPAPPPRPAKPNNSGIPSRPPLHSQAVPVAPRILTLNHPPPSSTIDGAACKTSTWTYKHVSSRNDGVAIIEKGARFKPEKRERRAVHKLQWRESAWPRGFTAAKDDYLDLDTRLSSSSMCDVSPQRVIAKILVLTESSQYKEAANLILKLPTTTFKTISNDLPIDVLIDAMPQSLPLIESLYCKLAETAPPSIGSTRNLRPEGVIWQMIRFFAQQEECLTGDIRWEFCGPFVTSCKKILRVIAKSEPGIRKDISRRRKQLEKAIEGMGHHGLVGTSDESLQSLHDALKLEFEKVVRSYTNALEKLQELSLSNKQSLQRSISHGPAPIQASHQRQLSVTTEEVQRRLIKNKTLLNVVEPTMNNHSLDILLEILHRRIEYDKESLFQFTQLKNESKDVNKNAVIAPILMRYSHGCEQILEMLKEAMEEDGAVMPLEHDNDSDVSGYHSDSDSAIMMSGNSPFVSKNARCNFLTRSVRDRSKVGVRNSLPFAVSRSNVTSGGVMSCGTSDTQSQGSNGSSDPKSGSVTPEGSRKEATGGSATTNPRGNPSGSKDDTTKKATKKEITLSSGERETSALRQEVETLRAEITKARQTILHMQEREKKLKERMGEQAVRNTNERLYGFGGSTPPKIESLDLQQNDSRPSVLVRKFAFLYDQCRLDALDALDQLPDLRQAEELKAKLLFSVVVLAFRSVTTSSTALRDEIRKLLQLTPPPSLPGGSTTTPSSCANDKKGTVPPVTTQESPDSKSKAVEIAVASYLARSVNTHDLSRNVEEVCEQIWATLYDYPCLRTCEQLLKYAQSCVRVAWGLVNQSPPYLLEYEERAFQGDLHVRFHSSDRSSEVVKTYLWPALIEGGSHPLGRKCVHQAVVIT